MTALHHPLPFDTFSPAVFTQMLGHQIKQTDHDIDALLQLEDCTYTTLLAPLDRIITRVSETFEMGQHLESIIGGSDWRAALKCMRPAITDLLTSIPLNQALYEQLERLNERRGDLTVQEQRHLDVTLEAFKLKGACLNEEDKSRLQQLELDLSKAAANFAQNIIDSTESIAIDVPVMDLAGLPENVRTQAIENGRSAGKTCAILSGDSVCVNNVLRFASARHIREAIWQAFYTRASSGDFDNRKLIEHVLELRTEKAALLGFDNIIALRLKTRMVEDEAAANAFLDGLVRASKDEAAAEHRSLYEFAVRNGLISEGADIEPWDLSFFAEHQRQKTCDFKDELLVPYTTLPSLFNGLFGLAKTLFGVDIQPLSDCPTWHADVRVFGVYEDDKLRGCFYVDIHPRPGKQGGAWMEPLCHRGSEDGVAVGVIAGNLSRGPTHAETALEHREVQTLFHEFGHLMHHLLSDVTIGVLAGTNVAWDFVELPSQLLENWVWSKSALLSLFKHKDTGDPIPSDLVDRLLRTRRFRSASRLIRQVTFSILDLELHRLEPGSDANHIALEIACRFSAVKLPSHYSMVTAFGHLFSEPVGYSAGYYSYLWAQMLEADVFRRFEAEGVFSEQTGRSFRESILAVGNSQSPKDAFLAFMGRAPQQDALLARHGLLESSNL
jgi:oligopeptidase A